MYSSQNLYFNSRPRVGGDVVRLVDAFVTEISIPAPAWGATVRDGVSYSEAIISIPAPAWGATDLRRSFARLLKDFNSRPRVGGDILSLGTLAFS